MCGSLARGTHSTLRRPTPECPTTWTVREGLEKGMLRHARSAGDAFSAVTVAIVVIPVLSSPFQSFPVFSQSFPSPLPVLARSVVCSTSVHNFSFERPYLCSFGCSSALSALLIRPWRIFDSSCRRETETEEDPSIRDLRRIVCTRHRFLHVREFHPYLDIRYD